MPTVQCSHLGYSNHSNWPTYCSHESIHRSRAIHRKPGSDGQRSIRRPIHQPVVITYKPPEKRMIISATDNHECSNSNSSRGSNLNNKIGQLLLGAVVSAATEFIRFFSSPSTDSDSEDSIDRVSERNPITSRASACASTTLQQVLNTIKLDYENAYFLTGKFSRSLYAKDCYFADPTISFTGRDLYERNLKLLIPFLDEPSLTLLSLQQQILDDNVDEEQNDGTSIKATWRLRTYLKFPWRPLIYLDGSTIYALDDNFLIVKHVESWSISPFNAIAQIFKRGDANIN